MRKDLNNGFEYEYEAQLGLPSALPKDEEILWQGSPRFGTVAKNVFYIRIVLIYFIGLITLALIDGYQENLSAKQLLISMSWMLMMSLIAISLLVFLAFCTVRTTVYTITNRRVVMRIGVVLTKTFNLPLSKIESADVINQKNHIGNIALKVESSTKIALFHLWPHARPWQIAHPEPMLLGLSQVEDVAQVLIQAWREINQQEQNVNGIKTVSKSHVKKNTAGLMPAFSNQTSKDFAQI